MEIKKGDRVKHLKRDLSEATFYEWSKSGKRIGVMHNFLRGRGVCMVVDYFSPKYIEKS